MTAFFRFSLLLGLWLAGCGPSARPACFDSASTRHTVPAPPAQVKRQLQVALTIDDLPGSYDPQPIYPKSRTMAEIVAALRAHQITEAVGFVNGIYAESDTDAQAGLQSWLEAGFEVGNHTYSHRSARELDVAAFLADVSKNQTFLGALSPAQRARFFRFPYLERGNTADERIAITQALASAGYRVANVSIDFTDWAFAAAHARCLARADESALRALSESYLQNANAALFWAADSAERLFGRSIPQVLLLHAHSATAQNLPALLTAYEQAGVSWISLEQALRDPAYAEPPGRDHGDTAVIAEAVRNSGALLRSFVPRPLALLELACR